MSRSALISATALLESMARGRPPVLLDCAFELSDPTAGERAYRAAHLPGAQYVHLERELSGALGGRNGRHPLPERDEFARRVGQLGIAPGVPVVAYDAQGGAYAARAWWLLRWLGHEDVAVLDGGPAAFVASGGRLVDLPAAPTPRPPYPAAAAATATMRTIDADILLASLDRLMPLDARAGERFRGDIEPIDPVAGHIPGARNRCFKDNLAADGRLKPSAELRAEFAALGITAANAASVVHHCGSGVTACLNVLAMELAGLDGSLLYPGSWSEWCADPARPVARG